MANGSTYVAGIIHFGADPGLGTNLAALRAQSMPPSRILVIDHSDDKTESEALRADHTDVEWISAPNRGYASGGNRVIAWADEFRPEADFVLVMNPDVELDPGFAEAVINAMSERPSAALASGRLLRPGGREIDSCGIEMARSRRFHDRGSELANDGRFGISEEVFAVSGAAMMLRRSMLACLSIGGEVFDEDFFVYHEDTDLAWRARNLGYSSLYVADATAVHVRGWRRGARERVPANIRRHSFKNRYLELIKNDVLSGFLRDLPFILGMEAARLGHAILIDRAVLLGYRDAFRHAGRAWRKRREIQGKIRTVREVVVSERKAVGRS